MKYMAEPNTSTFYAVRPELVLRAARLFDVRASILDGGARSLYNKAVALSSGKASGRWGKHQQLVIKQFCEYTVITGSDALLPWHELVDDEMNYDGKEGISARTGNRPLATVQRVGIDIEALQQARVEQSLDLANLALRCGLPLRFLEAIEAGEWRDVAISTAECIATVLGLPPESLFIYPETDDTEDTGSTGFTTEARRQQQSLSIKLKSYWLVLALLVLGSAIWLLYVNWQIATPAMEDFTSSQWRMSVELMNHNIPIPEEAISLWRNGGYIQLREHGVVAFNWIDPGALVELPNSQVSWEVSDRRMTLKLDNIVYPFTIGEDRETLVVLDTTRSFEMTLQAISR